MIFKSIKKNFLLTTFIIVTVFLVACGNTNEGSEPETSEERTTEGVTYMNITAEEAKEIMDTETDYVILDVRTEGEFDEGHIPGAVLIPDYEIEDKAEKELTDKNQLILVYCRSGRRSKNAAQSLADLGYTNIKEFGGIIDWPYGVE